MVEVRDDGAGSWQKRELLADLSIFDVLFPFVVRSSNPKHNVSYKEMREIETKPMKFSEFCEKNADEHDLDLIYESYQHYLGYFKKGDDE